MTTTPPRIDPRLGAAALRAPAASKEDSCPQAILKFQPHNSLDDRVRYEPQLKLNSSLSKHHLIVYLHWGNAIKLARKPPGSWT